MPEPTDAFDALDDYATAVGMVVYEWNYLHEELGRLFVVVRNEDKGRLLTKWWSCKTDAGQRTMLKDAVTNAPKVRWQGLPKAAPDLNWLLKRVNALLQSAEETAIAPDRE